MRTEESKVTCTGVAAHTYKPELDSAELRMTVNTFYPKRHANSEGLFTESEYGLDPEEPFKSVRVAWIDVPKGTTIEQVQARIDAVPKARIKRIMSLKPILSPEQIAGIEKGLTTLDKIAEKQTVKRADGTVVLYDEKYTQYKKNQPSWTGKADVEMRPALTKAAEVDVVIAEEIAETA